MSLQIYNSLTRKKETLKPIKDGEVGIYVCGVTVYAECHIGHARSGFVFEVIRNYLEYKGYEVKFVKNITDVDDKIIAKAKEEFPDAEINEAVKKVAEKYTIRYHEDMAFLGVRRPTIEPLATEHIDQMQYYIAGLIEKGYAYESGGNVYFDVHKFRDYGKLSHQNLEQMLSAVRIEKDEYKKDSLDFALWKKAKDGEPFWDSPWGRGRPGWHIECSVMSTKYLGEEFDIHGGGMDLIFPHHENEVAQSNCFSDKGFAKIWIHNGLLTINGQKMSKSLGNFVTIKDFKDKYEYHPDVLKLFFLQTHYSQPIDFTWERMEEKREALNRILSFFSRVKMRAEGKVVFTLPDIKAISPADFRNKIEEFRKDFEKSMDDDFNTPRAIAVLFGFIEICNKVLSNVTFTQDHLAVLMRAEESIKEIGNILGLSFKEGPLSISPEEINGWIERREDFKKKKMFKEADQIRNDLEAKGIILEDTKEGTIWRRKA